MIRLSLMRAEGKMPRIVAAMGIDQPRSVSLYRTSDPADAMRMVVHGAEEVDYSLMPDPHLQWQDLQRFAKIFTNTRVLTENLPYLNTLRSILDLEPIIDLAVEPTPLLDAVIDTLPLNPNSDSMPFCIRIRAPGWAKFMQRVYDSPALFPNLRFVCIYNTPLRNGELYIPVRADQLSVHCHDRSETAVFRDAIIPTINNAVCRVLNIHTSVNMARIANSNVAHFSAVLAEPFLAELPNLISLDCSESQLDVAFDGARYPRLQDVQTLSMSRNMFVGILRTTPSLVEVPSGEIIGMTDEDMADAIQTHAPHLLERFRDPDSFHWTPRMHAAFASKYGARISALVLGAQRCSDAAMCAAFDPAAFEECIRHLRIDDHEDDEDDTIEEWENLLYFQ